MRFEELLKRLHHELPRFGPENDPDTQIRAVLRPVVERMSPNIPTDPVPSDPQTCPNCGQPAASAKTPYCSDQCRAHAAFVRQFRSSLKDGSILEPQRQMGLGQALWSLQGGGFPRRQMMIEPKIVAKVIEKQGGKCQICGKPATEVYHVGSACNRTSNLRAVCAECNPGKGFGEADYQPSKQVQALYDDYAARIAAEPAVRICDDAEIWDWRAYLKARVATGNEL